MITTKFRAEVGLKEYYIPEKPLEYVIHYVKDNIGAPGAAGLSDECCLNTFEKKLYKFDGSVWNVIAILSGQKFCFALNGSSFVGCGNNSADQKIYTFNGIDFVSKIADDGSFILIKNSSRDIPSNCLLVWDISSLTWIKPSSASLQDGEGINLVYNDAADTLTISAELAESGDNTANKGIASFSDNSFTATAGFIELSKVNGGNF